MDKVKIETVQGYTKKKALESAQSFADTNAAYDATTAWKKAGEPTDSDLTIFAEDYKAKKKIDGGVFVITAIKGSPDTRNRPYKVQDIVNKGGRKYQTMYEVVVDTASGELVVDRHEKKNEARKAATAYTTANKITTIVRPAKVVKEGQARALVVKYVPSKDTQLGTYIIFG